MKCFNPLIITRHAAPFYIVPCGACFSCRSNKTNEWARRILHTAQDYSEVTFLTLTYDDNMVTGNMGDLDYHRRELRGFHKRLLKHRRGARYQHFSVSQYGENTGRLHYHIILFGVRYDDPAIRKAWSMAYHRRNNQYEYHPIGFIKSKPFHPKNAYYVSRYVARYYSDTPTVLSVSRRPYLGANYVSRNSSKYFRHCINELVAPGQRSVAGLSLLRPYIRQWRKSRFTDVVVQALMRRQEKIRRVSYTVDKYVQRGWSLKKIKSIRRGIDYIRPCVDADAVTAAYNTAYNSAHRLSLKTGIMITSLMRTPLAQGSEIKKYRRLLSRAWDLPSRKFNFNEERKKCLNAIAEVKPVVKVLKNVVKAEK